MAPCREASFTVDSGKTADSDESVGDSWERLSDALERLVTSGKTDDPCERAEFSNRPSKSCFTESKHYRTI